MTILYYAVAVIIILGLCALGLSIGLLLRGRALQTCGRAQTKTGDGEEISCPSCGAGECKRKKEEAVAATAQ
ncbi:MAG TPA: hypothetical protein PKE12_04425 [Kiritimatiellia bacterium]|nr:hypothetical protein [Kiritimatiellia bacterium]